MPEPSRRNELIALGRILSIARKNMQLSLRGLAKKSGVSVSQLSKWENGEFEPTLFRFADVCDALDLSVQKTLDTIRDAANG